MESKKEFIKALKQRDAHILKIIAVGSTKQMIYYREFGSMPTDVKHQVVTK